MKDNETDQNAAAAAAADGGEAPAPGPSKVPPGKKLVLRRIVTKTYPDGRVERIVDDVAADVGDAWMGARRYAPDGSLDLEASRDAVMKILYPHGRAVAACTRVHRTLASALETKT